ncbi:MAG: sigma-54 dependent transcriptional regulator [bacterium]|nr:sigma-54 dependent transcriptional regulator [bacterium]
MENKILIIDDEKNILSILSDILKDAGYSVFTAGTGEEGLKILKKEDINLLFLDVRLPDINGIDLLKQIKKEESAVEVIMISGHATIDIAIQATKLGAYDFIEKPLSLERVKIAVTHAMEKTNLVKEKDELIKINASGYEILGESKAIKYIKAQIEKCAPSDSKVLILGETGTGKELVATAIHTQSTRKTAPFIKVNCASIPESLIESELLGHEKGAFTGAVSRKIGKFELADKGTIFLDEIGDMGLSCQAKVLRVLENGEFERVGGLTSIKVDVRIVAATNKDLLKEIEKGKFREDLYYRLNVMPIYIPPLRERKTDIPVLAKHLMNLFCRERGLPTKEFEESAMDTLSNYSYPGNIRELRNIIERIAIMTQDEKIKTEDISFIVGTKKVDDIFSESLSLSDAQKKLLKRYVETQLENNKYDMKKTAEALGIERPNLYRKMRELGIQK